MNRNTNYSRHRQTPIITDVQIQYLSPMFRAVGGYGFSQGEIRQARSHCEKKRHIVLSFKVINSSICRFRNNLSGRIPLCLWTCVRVECEDSLAKSVAKIMISLTICALQRRFFVSIRQFFFSEEAEDVEYA